MSLPLMGGMMNEPTHLEWSLPPKPSDNTNDVSIMEEAQPEQDKEDVLRAMLYVAEDEIRAKEVQVELMQQMLVTTESVPEDTRSHLALAPSTPLGWDHCSTKCSTNMSRISPSPHPKFCLCRKSTPKMSGLVI